MRNWPLLLAALAALVLTGGVPAEPVEPLCAPGAGGLRPSTDIYCMELVARPEVPAFAGMVELGRAASPLDIAVSVAGNQRYQATLVLDQLPDPAALGDFTTFVAWVAPPSLEPLTYLGPLKVGRNPLGEIGFDKFLVFVSAEPDARPRSEWTKLVARGMSPSIRMQQHSMLMVAGTQPEAEHDHAAMEETSGDRLVPPAKWFMPPMRPNTPIMPMPAMMEMEPPAVPFLPGVGLDPASLPEAVPQKLVRVRNGDTLELTAGLVRRTLLGRPVVMYAYNRQYPGPLIQADQGDILYVRFKNEIDLPSAVHWHGIRLENWSDGVPGVTQAPVEPGGEFLYKVTFKDAGIYWYHPHLREDIQQDLGLYGNILVKSKRPDAFGPANREETLILDDLVLGERGLLPYGKEHATHALMGRFGNVMLVNGSPDYSLEVKRGEVVRFYVTDVSNVRSFNLTFPGARMKLVGADVGRYEREEWVESVPIAPAQRYIVDVRFPTAGTVPLMNQVQAIDHNIGTFFADFDTLGRVAVAAEPARPDHRAAFETLRENRDVVTEIDAYRQWFTKPAEKELLLTLRLGEIAFGVRQMMLRDQLYSHPVEWSGTMPMMDWLTTTAQAEWVMRDPATGHENMAIDWKFKLGDIVKIRLANDRATLHPMPHPIHLHGQRFLVLAHNDVPATNLVWKDTILVPVGGTVDLLVEMSNPGKWMMQCHIAEHLEAGMMGVFEVTR